MALFATAHGVGAALDLSGNNLRVRRHRARQQLQGAEACERCVEQCEKVVAAHA